MNEIIGNAIEIGLFILILSVGFLFIWRTYKRIISNKANNKSFKKDRTDSVLSKIQTKYYEPDARNTPYFKIKIDSSNELCTIFLRTRTRYIECTSNYLNFKSKYVRSSINLASMWKSQRRSYFDALLYYLIIDFTEKKISYQEFINHSIETIHRFNSVEDYGFELIGTGSFIRFYRFVGEYEIISELIKAEYHRFDFSLIHEIELNTESKQLDTATLVYKCGVKHLLNGYTIENLDEFYNYVDGEINKIYGSNYSFFKALFGKDLNINEIMNEFPDGETKSKSYYYSKRKEEPIVSYLAVRNRFPEKCKKYYYYGMSKLFVHPYREFPTFNLFLEGLLQEIFSSVILSNENKFRVSRGIPKIGEGWVSETNLFYQIKKRFSNVEVIQHGRPRWLGNQHVDIWLPDYRLGIEYHGKQHFEAVEFFGGNEGFLKTKERDKRKRFLFEQNNAYLIEVQNGYNIEIVYRKIEQYISTINCQEIGDNA